VHALPAVKIPSLMDDDGDGLTGSLGAKLGGWCALYGVAMIFIVLRIFARLYIFGALTLDDWLMVVAAVAYSGSMITEIFLYLAFQNFNIVAYIKVSKFLRLHLVNIRLHSHFTSR
jgi:hypothetical protein